MARITAERLVEHLERAGFVLTKRPPLRAPSRAAPPIGAPVAALSNRTSLTPFTASASVSLSISSSLDG